MKKVLKTLVVILVLIALSCPAFAAEQTTNVRVNGYKVSFPDQQPIIDENRRTLIPVRFVAEELGADVSWDGQAAVIEKDGTTITVPIGSNELTVINASGSTTVEMDTEAVLKNGRTLVPIRFVAEAMGAWVSYSNAFNAVQIYDDELTPEEINKVHEVSLKWDFNESKAAFKDGGSTFEDLNENAFQHSAFVSPCTITNIYDGQTWNTATGTVEELTNMFMRYSRDCIGGVFTYEEYGVHATFRTDASCVISSPASSSSSPYLIFGYLTITCDDDADISAYKSRYSDGNFNGIQAGTSKTYLVETFWMAEANYGRPFNMGVWNRTGGVYDQWY